MDDIDGLTGRELDKRLCLAMGFQQTDKPPLSLISEWHCGGPFPVDDGFWFLDSLGESRVLQEVSNDIGAAMNLLMSLGPWLSIEVGYDDGAWVVEVIDQEYSDDDPLRVVSRGPLAEAASVICRGCLRLKLRMNDEQ